MGFGKVLSRTLSLFRPDPHFFRGVMCTTSLDARLQVGAIATGDVIERFMAKGGEDVVLQGAVNPLEGFLSTTIFDFLFQTQISGHFERIGLSDGLCRLQGSFVRNGVYAISIKLQRSTCLFSGVFGADIRIGAQPMPGPFPVGLFLPQHPVLTTRTGHKEVEAVSPVVLVVVLRLRFQCSKHRIGQGQALDISTLVRSNSTIQTAIQKIPD